MEFFTQTEKEEKKDELHKDYGVVSNCIYILKRFRKYRPSLIFFIITGAAAAASMSYIWSFIGKLVIDMIQASAGGGDILPLVRLVAATTAAELFIMWLSTVSTVKTGLGFTYVRLMIIKERIAKTLDMDYEALETPEMLDRLQKAKRATAGDWQGVQGMMTYMQVLFTQIISIIIAIIIMTSFDPLIILVIAVLSYIQFLYFEHIRKKDKKEMWDAMMPHWRKLEYMETVTTDFSYAKDIRLFGMKKFLAKKQKDVYDEELRHWIKSRQYWIYNSIFSHGISLVRQLIITGWLVYSVIAKDLSIGNFTLYLASAGAFSNAINEVLSALSALRERSAHTDDYRSFMDIPGDSGRDIIPVPKADKYVFTFENVSFKYKGQEKYALKNLNITIAAGEKLAVVGLNGAGKSTFIKLLLRLYDVTEGRILMNGTDIRRFDRAEYYRLFSPAFQDVTVFAFPMAENVSMSPPDETDKNKAEKCVREAGLGDKMDKLEKGIDTELLKVLYDDGVDLSGGEKQKLALARALYKGSDVIVLDEPTAALDALAEYRLYKSFNGLVGNRTAVYISHRLSSTRFCDRVAMFKDGEMTETGTHEELMEKNGDYAEMFRVQAQYYVEDRDIFDTAPAEAVTD